jgi:hypothetical protein
MKRQKQDPQAMARPRAENKKTFVQKQYPVDPSHVKPFCMFCGYFRAVRLQRGVRTFCQFLGERVKPGNGCSYYIASARHEGGAE